MLEAVLICELKDSVPSLFITARAPLPVSTNFIYAKIGSVGVSKKKESINVYFPR